MPQDSGAKMDSLRRSFRVEVYGSIGDEEFSRPESFNEPQKAHRLPKTLGKPLPRPTYEPPTEALPCLTYIGPASWSREIGEMPSTALGPRTDLPSVDQPSKKSKSCHYMYASDLGKTLTYL